MTAVVIDIETRSDEAFWAEHGEALYADLKPDGRLKDPEKIAADLDAKRAALLEQAPLSWTTGRVCAIGLAALWSKEIPGLGDDVLVLMHEDEATLLRQFAATIEEIRNPVWCGFNVRSFDLPYLAFRLVKHQIRWPGSYPQVNNYERIIDVRDIWKSGTCDLHLRALGLPPKTAKGDEVATMTDQELHDYCAADVERERLLIRSMVAGGLFPRIDPRQRASA